MKRLSLILCAVLLLASAVPVAAEDAVYTVPVGIETTTDELRDIDPFCTIVNYGTITGGGALANSLQNYGVIAGGSFSGTVENLAESSGATAGRITGGTFTGPVKNTGVNASLMPSITGGTFTGYIDNSGYITGGTFTETSEIYNHFIGLKGGEFRGTVRTSRYPINGGVYSGTVVLEQLGSITAGTFTETAAVTQKTAWTYISGGEFYCPVNNIGFVSGGSFHAAFTNGSTVSYGVFYGEVENLAAGTIYSSSGRTPTLLNGNVVNHGLIYGCDFGPDATVENDGEFYVLVTVSLPAGVNPTFAGKFFRYGERVTDGLARYDAERGLQSSWLRLNGYTVGMSVLPAVEIEPDRTFSLQASENRFIRTPTDGFSHTEHVWSAPRFSWANDCSSATAFIFCEEAGETHQITHAARIGCEITKEPTCSVPGTATYTATAEFFGDTVTDRRTVALPTADHRDENGDLLCDECGAMTPACDVNGDGETDIRDLVHLKRCLADGLPADLDGDGETNAADLLLLRRALLK